MKKKAMVASVLFFALLLAGCVGMVVSERPAYEYYPVYRPPEAYQVLPVHYQTRLSI